MNLGGLSNHFHQEWPHLPPAGNWRRLRPCWFWRIFLDSWICQECDFEGQPARPAAWEAEAFQQLLGAAAHFHCLVAITVELNWVNESMAGRKEEPQFHLFLQDARPGPAQGVPSCLWRSAPRVPGRKPSTPSPQLWAQDEFPEGNGAAMPGGVHQPASAPHPGL